MKKIFIVGAICLSTFLGFGQKTLNVVSKEIVVEKITRKGLAITLELDEKFVKENWKKFIKDFGKSDSKGSSYWIDIANIPSISNSPVKMYSSLESSGKGTMLWLGIDLGDKHVIEGGEGYEATKSLLKEFGLSCYRQDFEDQINEASKALESSQKKDEKVIKEGEKLTSDHQNNASDKIKFEEALKKNASEKVQIEKDIDQNKKDQVASKDEVAKMKKALELKQAELSQLK
jgi:ABC-type antimicrobial peptide transport system permease subunit